MSFMDLAKTRYSAREFKDAPIEADKLAAVLEAGRLAPTACNNQPQRVKVITAPEDLAKIDACTGCRFGAPAVLLVCYDKSAVWVRKFDKANSGEVDASIYATHLILAAEEQGLGTCWVMWFDPAKTREEFNLPENIVPVAMLPIGYTTENCKPAPQHESRRPLDDMLL